METSSQPFDDTLLRTMEKLIEKEKKKPKKKFLVSEKRLMYYSGWHKDDKKVTLNTIKEHQQQLSL